MRTARFYIFLILAIVGLLACKHKTKEAETKEPFKYKGLYSLGPDAKTYKDCTTGREYWIRDSTNTLELKYWEIVPHETPEAPVYLEVEGIMEISSQEDDDGHGNAAGYDSTLMVTKIIKITKDIPAGMCKN